MSRSMSERSNGSDMPLCSSLSEKNEDAKHYTS